MTQKLWFASVNTYGEVKVKKMAEKKQKDDITKLSFEEAIRQLTSIVEKIEQGEIPLESSLQHYERGMALIAHCRTVLQKAEKRIEKIGREQQTEDRSQKTDDG